MNIKLLLRWILLIPLTFVAWYLIFALSLFLYFYIDKNFCPASDIFSNTCYNKVIVQILKISKHIFVGFSAVVVIFTSITIAPSHKKTVAWTFLALGSIASFYLGHNSWSLIVSAILSGLLSVLAYLKYGAKNA